MKSKCFPKIEHLTPYILCKAIFLRIYVNCESNLSPAFPSRVELVLGSSLAGEKTRSSVFWRQHHLNQVVKILS